MLLTRTEETYLAIIIRLGENAYGVPIRQAVFEKTGRRISYGALYFALDQLVKKGLVVKHADDPTPVRGGRTKFIFSLTDTGRESLQETADHDRALRADLKELLG